MLGLLRLRHLQVGDLASSVLEMGDMTEDSWQSYCAFWSDNCFSSWVSGHPSFGRGYGGLHHLCLEPKPSYPQGMQEDLGILKQLMAVVRDMNERPALALWPQHQMCVQTHG